MTLKTAFFVSPTNLDRYGRAEFEQLTIDYLQRRASRHDRTIGEVTCKWKFRDDGSAWAEVWNMVDGKAIKYQAPIGTWLLLAFADEFPVVIENVAVA